MDAAEKAEIQAYSHAIAALLYEEADAEQVQTLSGHRRNRTSLRKHRHCADVRGEPLPQTLMSSEDQAALVRHSREIAKILYRNSAPEAVDTLEGIATTETTVRQQMLEHVSPEVGIFWSKRALTPNRDAPSR